MKEYHVYCRLLSELNTMTVSHCILLSYIVIMIINIRCLVSLPTNVIERMRQPLFFLR
jgi:hypothetical protein